MTDRIIHQDSEYQRGKFALTERNTAASAEYARHGATTWWRIENMDIARVYQRRKMALMGLTDEDQNYA